MRTTKRRARLVTLFVGLALFVMRGASIAQSGSDAAEESAIRAARAASNEAIRKHDADDVASCWTEDYNLVASTSQVLEGREPNRANLEQHFVDRPDVVYVRTPKEIGFYRPWGMAYEIGEWEGGWTEAEGKVAIGGTYLAKWKKVDDRWLIQAEIFVPTHCDGTSYCGERR